MSKKSEIIPGDKSSLERLCLYGAVGLLIYMPFHVFLSQWLSTVTGGLDFWKIGKDLITLLVTILCISTVIYRRKRNSLYVVLLGLITAYALLHCVVMLATKQPTETGFLAIIYNLRIFGYLIIGVSLGLMFSGTKLPNKFIRLLIILSTLVCLFAIVQRFLPGDILTHFGYGIDRGAKPNFYIDEKPDFPRVFSTLRDPNSLGAFLILPITYLLYAFIRSSRNDQRQLLGGVLLLHVLVLFLTFSRSTLLASLLSLAVVGLYVFRAALRRHWKIVGVVVVTALMLLVSVFMATRDNYVTKNLVLHADEKTVMADPNELRVSLFKRGIEGVIDQPLGHGPGTAGLVSTRLPNGLLTENYFLQIAYEVGIFGLVIFLAILYRIITPIWRHKDDGLALVLVASFIGLVFANLLFHTFANEAVAVGWFMIAGVYIGAKKLV